MRNELVREDFFLIYLLEICICIYLYIPTEPQLDFCHKLFLSVNDIIKPVCNDGGKSSFTFSPIISMAH